MNGVRFVHDGPSVSMRSVLFVAVVVCLGIGAVTLGGFSDVVGADSDDIVVASDGSGDYGTIQDAVNDASPGDTVVVEDGTYVENVTVDVEDLTIEAADGHQPTIEGNDSIGPALRLTAENVTVDGPTVGGFNFSDVDVTDSRAVHIEGANATLENMMITDIHDPNDGVVLVEGPDATLSNLIISENTGMGFREAGVKIQDERAQLVDSEIINNDNRGVQAFGGGNDALIVNNTISDNGDRAIGLDNAHRAEIRDNYISDNRGEGIGQQSATTPAHDLLAVNNTIIGNTERGIWTSSGTNATLGDNLVEDNRAGIDVAEDATVRNNVLVGNDDFRSDVGGIAVGTDSTVTDNEITDIDGVGIEASTNSVVVNNTATGADVAFQTHSNVGENVTVEELNVGDSTAPDTTLSFEADFLELSTVSDPPATEDVEPIDRYVEVVGVGATPEDAVFDTSIHYDTSDVDNVDEESLHLARYVEDDEEWVDVQDSTIDTDEQTVSRNLTHLSDEEATFGVFGEADDVDDFSYFSVDIDGTDSPVAEGEELTVDATIENTGDEPGAQTIELLFEDEVVDEEEVSRLNIRESESIELTWDTSTEEPDIGEHELTVSSEDDEASETVRIEEDPGATVSITDTDDGVVAEVRNAEGGDPVRIPSSSTEDPLVGVDGVDLSTLNVTLAADAGTVDYDLGIEAADELPGELDHLPDDAEGLMVVGVDVSDDHGEFETESSTFEYRVSPEALEPFDYDPPELALFHNVDDDWVDRGTVTLFPGDHMLEAEEARELFPGDTLDDAGVDDPDALFPGDMLEDADSADELFKTDWEEAETADELFPDDMLDDAGADDPDALFPVDRLEAAETADELFPGDNWDDPDEFRTVSETPHFSTFALGVADADDDPDDKRIDAENVTVDAGESGEITVAAEDGDGEPIADEEIEVAESDDLSGLESSVTTDADGVATFDFDESDAGTYEVTFELADDDSITDTATVTVGEPVFELLDIDIDESPVPPGEQYNVQIDAENTASVDGEAHFELHVDNETVRTFEQEFEAGEERSVTFMNLDAPDELGEYNLTVSTDDSEITDTLKVDNVSLPVYNADQELHYATIQDAVNDSSPGDTIQLENETYEEDVFSHTSLTIEAADDRPTVIGGFHARDDHLTIRGLEITGGYDGEIGITTTLSRPDVGTGYNLTVEDTVITETGDAAIDVPKAEELTIDDVTIAETGATDADASVQVAETETVSIAGLESNDSDGAGVHLKEVGTVDLEDIEVVDASAYGIYVMDAGDVTVENASVDEVSRPQADRISNGIVIGDADDVAVSEFAIEGVFGTSVAINGGQTAMVDNGTVDDSGFGVSITDVSGEVDISALDLRPGGVGVSISGTDDIVTISAIDVRNTNNGILTEEATELVVENSTILDASDGLRINASDAATVTDTTIERTAETDETSKASLEVANAADVSISGLEITDSDRAGVSLEEVGTVVVEDIAVTDAVYYGMHVLDAEDVTVENASIQTVSGTADDGLKEGDGIRIAGTILGGTRADVSISEFTIEGSEGQAIRIANTQSATVANGTVTDSASGVQTQSVTDDINVSTLDLRTDGRAATISGGNDGVRLSEIDVRDAEKGILADTLDLTVENSTILDTEVGLEMYASDAATVTDTEIVGNDVGLVNKENSTEIDARENWWGSPNGPGGEGPGDGDPVYGNVLVEPWLEIDSLGTPIPDYEFAGIVADDRQLPVMAEAVTDGDDELVDGSVTVQLRSDGEMIAEDEANVTDGELATTIDTTDLEVDIENVSTGKADIVLVKHGETVGGTGTVELVHEAYDLDDGYSRWSVPQPATLELTDGVMDVTTWDVTDASYDDVDGSSLEGVDLHQGLYINADGPDERIGYDFAEPGQEELPPGSTETIEPGWNLLSSNYDISSGTETLNLDLNTVSSVPANATEYEGDEGMVAHDPPSFVRLGGDEVVDPFDTYWIYLDEGEDVETRAISAAEYDPAARVAAIQSEDVDE